MMISKTVNKLRSAVLSGVVAVTALAAPLSTAVTPSISAIAAGSDDYAKLLQYSLYFYDANMCGDQVDETSKMTWRSDCHTSDEVKGGFHDAGDHAMFGLPQGFTASVLGWSYYEFKDAYSATGQTSHLKTVLNYFCDFFKASTKLDGSGNVTNFLYQKGDGNEDHSYWGSPELQTGSRKMFWTSNSASDIAADYAAALALNYINFGNAEDLKYAEALYNFSTQNNRIETNGPSGFYLSQSPDCKDEQANAAGWLYLATNNEKYKTECAEKQTQYLGWCDGWDNRGLGAACVYAHITNDWGKVNNYLSTLCSGSNYLCMDDWGSARLNCSVQFTALAASKNSNADFTGWCKNQMNYILGDNPFNTCLVTGFASNSAKNSHHRAASGYQGYEGSDGMNEYTTTYHPTKSHVLIGALVGGPNKSGQYSDVMNDYQCNEVALDYNAGLVGAAAGLYSVYKTGSTVSSIEGVSSVYSDSGQGDITTTTTTNGNVTTTTTTTKGSETTATTTVKPSGNGKYTITPDQYVDYSTLPEDDKMFGWEWSEFGIPAGEKVTKVEVNITAKSGSIGKWQGAFGSSTTKSPDYWTQTDEMEQKINSSSGTITWNVDSDTASIIQYNYGGELKFGVWWIDCGQFTVDSVVVYTNGSSSGTTATTSKSTTTTTTNTTTTTTTVKPSGNGKYTITPDQYVDYSTLPEDDKMFGWEWSEFGIPAGEKVTKVEVNITAKSGSIGKWQGAFGSSTTVSPEYWTQSDDMEQKINSSSGTITWNVDSDTSSIIQYNYGGELKFGVWWIDCGQFNIDSVVVYTDGKSATTTTTTTTTTSTTTTTTTTTTTGERTPGDSNCDGDVNLADAVLIMQYSANPDEYGLGKSKGMTQEGLANADVIGNNDGVTNLDALQIQKFKLGLVSKLS